MFAIFAFFSGFSGQFIYDEWAMALYNVCFTALPVLCYGFFEQDISPMTARNFPYIYKVGQNKLVINMSVFTLWLLEAMWDNAWIFSMSFWILSDGVVYNGTNYGIWEVGNLAFTANLWVMTLRIAIETQHFTVVQHVCYWGSIALWYGFIIGYCWLPPNYYLYDTRYYSFQFLLGSPVFWLTKVVMIMICLLPTVIVYSYYIVMTPSVGGSNTKSSWLPDSLGGLSILYHLRHYMKYPQVTSQRILNPEPTLSSILVDTKRSLVTCFVTN